MKPNSDQSIQDLNSNELAYNTAIAAPEGYRQIQAFQVGDPVLAFSAKLESGKIKLTPSNAKISFSDGIDSRQKSLLLLIHFKSSSDSIAEFLCTLNQPFLLSNGKYVQAQNLQIGEELVDKDGNPMPIVQIIRSSFQNGIHAIATDAPGRNPDGHLLLANGVIIGDFLFQIGFHDLDD